MIETLNPLVSEEEAAHWMGIASEFKTALHLLLEGRQVIGDGMYGLCNAVIERDIRYDLKKLMESRLDNYCKRIIAPGLYLWPCANYCTGSDRQGFEYQVIGATNRAYLAACFAHGLVPPYLGYREHLERIPQVVYSFA